MRREAPFQPDDLAELDALLSSAHAVIAIHDQHNGNRRPDTIALRHDVDNHPQAFLTAVRMARWEAERGYRSTYYLLHTARYWTSDEFLRYCEIIAECGHEIGLHADAIGAALQHGGDPDGYLLEALGDVRQYGIAVHGVAGHGNRLLNEHGAANDQQFVEGPKRPGAPTKLEHEGRELTIEPRPLADYRLRYEAVATRNAQPGIYNTDSAGRWFHPFHETVDEWRYGLGQLTLDVHPDWWSEAFVR